MTEEEAKKWVKDKANQAHVTAKFFADYKPTTTKLGFFMAGVPGAGKTEFAENTLREITPSLVPIEHDKLVEYIPGYKPENYYNYRKAGSTLVTKIFDECLKQGYAFIFDGTLSHPNGIRNIKKAIKIGYPVYVVYIVQEAKLAWELTQARELNKKRSIEKAGFIDTCNRINDSLLKIFKAYKSNSLFNFWAINKQGIAGMENATAIVHGLNMDKHTQIEKLLNTSYNIEEI